MSEQKRKYRHKTKPNEQNCVYVSVRGRARVRAHVGVGQSIDFCRLLCPSPVLSLLTLDSARTDASFFVGSPGFKPEMGVLFRQKGVSCSRGKMIVDFLVCTFFRVQCVNFVIRR